MAKPKLEEQLAEALKALETITQERDDARAEAARLADEIAALKTRLDGLQSSPPPSLPVPKSSEPLPPGITEEMVRGKMRESLGGLNRAACIRILQRHAERKQAP